MDPRSRRGSFFVQALATQIWAAALVAVCGLALWRGGRLEKLFALMMLAAWLVTVAVMNPASLVDPQWGIFAVDAVLLAAMVWMSLATRKVWILPATAFQLLTVVTHVAILADPGVRVRAYLAGLAIWGWMVLACLALAMIPRLRRARPS